MRRHPPCTRFVAASVACGCSLRHMQQQPPSHLRLHAVAASVACGCSLRCMRLQASSRCRVSWPTSCRPPSPREWVPYGATAPARPSTPACGRVSCGTCGDRRHSPVSGSREATSRRRATALLCSALLCAALRCAALLCSTLSHPPPLSGAPLLSSCGAAARRSLRWPLHAGVLGVRRESRVHLCRARVRYFNLYTCRQLL